MGLLTAYLNRNLAFDKVAASNDEMMRQMIADWSQQTGTPFDAENMSRAAVKRAYRQLHSSNPAFRKMVTNINEAAAGAGNVAASATQAVAPSNRPIPNTPAAPSAPATPNFPPPGPKLLTEGKPSIVELGRGTRPGSEVIDRARAEIASKKAIEAYNAPIHATIDKYKRAVLAEAGVDPSKLTAEQVKAAYNQLRTTLPIPPKMSSVKDLTANPLLDSLQTAKRVSKQAGPKIKYSATAVGKAGSKLRTATRATGKGIGHVWGNKGKYGLGVLLSELGYAAAQNRKAEGQPVPLGLNVVSAPSAAFRTVGDLIGKGYRAVVPKDSNEPKELTRDERLRQELQGN